MDCWLDHILPGRERCLVERRDLEGESFAEAAKLQLALDKLQRVAWIESLVEPTGWEIMATLTFRWEASAWSAERVFTRWIRKRLPGVSYFYAIEPNPNRYGHHLHSLWADASRENRKVLWQEVFKRWGRARIEPVRSKRDSSAYASKYLCKPNAWYDVKLQWHRLQRLRGESSFSLEREPDSSAGHAAPGALPLQPGESVTPT